MAFGARANLESPGDAAVKADPFIEDRYPIISIRRIPIDNDCGLVLGRRYGKARLDRIAQPIRNRNRNKRRVALYHQWSWSSKTQQTFIVIKIMRQAVANDRS